MAYIKTWTIGGVTSEFADLKSRKRLSKLESVPNSADVDSVVNHLLSGNVRYIVGYTMNNDDLQQFPHTTRLYRSLDADYLIRIPDGATKIYMTGLDLYNTGDENYGVMGKLIQCDSEKIGLSVVDYTLNDFEMDVEANAVYIRPAFAIGTTTLTEEQLKEKFSVVSITTDIDDTNLMYGLPKPHSELILENKETVDAIKKRQGEISSLDVFDNMFNLETVINDQTPCSLLFMWCSDTHYTPHYYNLRNTIYGTPLETLEEMALNAKTLGVDGILHCGDIVDGRYSIEHQKSDLRKVDETFRKSGVPVFYAEGNHDDNSWYISGKASTVESDEHLNNIEHVLQPHQFFANCGRRYSKMYSSSGVQGSYGYFYHDFPSQKIRLIVLNNCDIPYTNDDGSILSGGQWIAGYREQQFKWFVNEALKFNESGWGVIIAQHQGTVLAVADTAMYPANKDNFETILTAFKNQTSGSIDGGSNGYIGTTTKTSAPEYYDFTLDYDFSNNGSNEIIAVMNGHVHSDNAVIVNGILRMTIINTFNTTGGGYDFVTIDRASKKIICRRWNGEHMPDYDRVVSYSESES